MSLSGLLPHLATVYRLTYNHNVDGGWSEEWESVVDDASCRVNDLNAYERSQYQKLEMTVDGKIYMLPSEVNVNAQDIIAVREDEEAATYTYYEVVGVRDIDLLGRLATIEVVKKDELPATLTTTTVGI